MLSSTKAIVLSLQPHSDKASILHAYTRAGGRVNYMVYGLGRKHAIGLYTPFSLIQITADYPSGAMTKPPTLKEAVALSNSCTEEVTQNTVRLFLCEILFHVLRHPMADEQMFDFLEQAVQELDQTKEPQNFHLQFLASFAAKLGFAMPKELPEPRTRAERQEQIRLLCDYFREHVETWVEPRSLEVLMEVFD